jgi:hypothetical protein
MSKKRLPEDFMGSFLSGKGEHTERAQSAHGEHTERTRPEYRGFKPTELVHCSIRLRAADLEALRSHFERIDVELGTGLRSWIVERMEREGLR